MPDSTHSRKGKSRPRPASAKNTPQKPRGVIDMGQLELHTLRGLYEQALLEKQQMAAQQSQLLSILMGILITRKDNRIVVKNSSLKKISSFSGVTPSEDEDGNLVVELVPLPDAEG